MSTPDPSLSLPTAGVDSAPVPPPGQGGPTPSPAGSRPPAGDGSTPGATGRVRRPVVTDDGALDVDELVRRFEEALDALETALDQRDYERGRARAALALRDQYAADVARLDARVTELRTWGTAQHKRAAAFRHRLLALRGDIRDMAMFGPIEPRRMRLMSLIRADSERGKLS